MSPFLLAETQADLDGKIIGSRWVNCNKNVVNDPDVRCPLVGQEIHTHADESFPSLEAKIMQFSQWATEHYRDGSNLQLGAVDVKEAYFYGVPTRNNYVRFPQNLECLRIW